MKVPVHKAGETAAPNPHAAVATYTAREIRTMRQLLAVVALTTVASILEPRIFGHARTEIAFLTPLLIGVAALLLIVNLHLAHQRKVLFQASMDLAAAAIYAEQLEQFSFFDPQTGLFNWRYLDQLFEQQLKCIHRTGRPATLVLFNVISDGQLLSNEEIAVEAASLLRENFWGSDYIVRNSIHQFLVLLPDTDEPQAQCALNRLNDKVGQWNLEHERSEIVLCHQLSTCSPGATLWDKLHEAEEDLLSRHSAPALRLSAAAPMSHNDVAQ